MIGKFAVGALSLSALGFVGLASQQAVAAEDYKITFKPFPEIKSADGKFSAAVTGFAQADAIFNIDDTFDHPSGTTIRRARLGVTGKMYGVLNYTMDFEFAPGTDGKINDAFLEYKASEYFSIKLGQKKNQTSFDFLSSVKHRAFNDTAFSVGLAPSRKFGLGLTYGGKQYAASFELSGESVDKRLSDDEGYSLTGRLSYAPILTSNTALHIGGAVNWAKPDQEKRSVSYSAKHETSTTVANSVYTGSIKDVDSTTIVNVDTFAKTGPVWLMGEYTQTHVDRFAGNESPTFRGWYVQAGWVLTGENRSYSPKKGVGGIKPKKTLLDGGSGAVELAVRYDFLDLTDGAIQGGEIERYSVNLLWYPFDKVQLRAGFQAANTDAFAVIPNDKPKAFVTRATWEF